MDISKKDTNWSYPKHLYCDHPSSGVSQAAASRVGGVTSNPSLHDTENYLDHTRPRDIEKYIALQPRVLRSNREKYITFQPRVLSSSR